MRRFTPRGSAFAQQPVDRLAPGIAVARGEIRLAADAELELDHALPFVRAEVGTVTLAVPGDDLPIDESVPGIGAGSPRVRSARKHLPRAERQEYYQEYYRPVHVRLARVRW